MPRLAFDAESGVSKVTVKALPASALHLPRGQLLVLPHVKLDGDVGHLTSQAGAEHLPPPSQATARSSFSSAAGSSRGKLSN